ncbi:hypothetical protein CPB83DRAFT_904618 [Crepidotus variabilis]|uniref:NAD(P)-binding protein n=1 Tax=Crepidotus variabilis TaxID=179855 RepID=A0A9P6EME6_9AGAR|nr:hypothetical protein CPB83DRAFT_904618 [Crepidotus variabilis]
MPSLAQARTANEAHFAVHGEAIPVAVFIGGTSGIGEAMVAAFGHYTKGNAHIAVIGRNRDAGERILSILPKPQNPSLIPQRVFIPCDVSLMKNVLAAANEIKAKFTKINYLILSTGLVDMDERTETAEGLEKKLSVSYYSRWLFIKEFVGLVEQAIVQDGPGRGVVSSILAPGHGGEIKSEDWEIKHGYSPGKVRTTAVTYNDLMVEAWADHHPKVPFVHAHPGIVRTPLFFRSPSYFAKFMGLLLVSLARFMTISSEESAEWMWYTINLTHTRIIDNSESTRGRESKPVGSWRTDPFGADKAKDDKYFGSTEKKDGLWLHTEEAISRSVNANF